MKGLLFHNYTTTYSKFNKPVKDTLGLRSTRVKFVIEMLKFFRVNIVRHKVLLSEL
jgi:hypothetical protein